jgi:hypothetical protein
MNFSDLQPGDLFTFRPLIGMPWCDRNLYRKATDRTYHRADKVLSILAIGSTMKPVRPASSGAMAGMPSRPEQEEDHLPFD